MPPDRRPRESTTAGRSTRTGPLAAGVIHRNQAATSQSSSIFGSDPFSLSSIPSSPLRARPQVNHPVFAKRKFKIVMVDDTVIRQGFGEPVTHVYNVTYEQVSQLMAAQAGYMNVMMALPPLGHRAVTYAQKKLNKKATRKWILYEDMLYYHKNDNIAFIFCQRSKEELDNMSEADSDDLDMEVDVTATSVKSGQEDGIIRRIQNWITAGGKPQTHDNDDDDDDLDGEAVKSSDDLGSKLSSQPDSAS